MTLLLAGIIALAALFVQGFSGFGSNLIMMPLLLLFLDIRTAVIVGALAQIPAGIWIVLRSRRQVDIRQVLRLLPTCILGLVIGAWLLARFDVTLLKRIFGWLTIAMAGKILFDQASRPERRGSWPPGSAYLAGGLSGVLGGAFGTSGPPIVVFLERNLLRADVLRASLLAYFLIVDCLRSVTYLAARLVTPEAVALTAVMASTACAGAFFGAKLQANVSERLFRTAVGIVLLASGVMLVTGSGRA